MIDKFIDFLTERSIPYKVTNGYREIYSNTESDSDFDILFKISDFDRIHSIIDDFCKKNDYQIVQLYYQGIHAKNYFLYDPIMTTFLNLDLYGELSRHHIKILNEHEVFNAQFEFHNISILSPSEEFIQYLIKKLDKNDLSNKVFEDLRELYMSTPLKCKMQLTKFFPNTHSLIEEGFNNGDYHIINERLKEFKRDFLTLDKTDSPYGLQNVKRLVNRIFRPTGMTIAFMGPDGAGKSTIIDALCNKTLPFRRIDYFHLKPLEEKTNGITKMVTNPHEFKPYSKFKSYIKLLYFIYQYNLGWFKNILMLKIKSSLVIFDRYYDDILVDNIRYRYGGSRKMAKLVGIFIPKPDIYFLLTTEAIIIHKRKQEVTMPELERQIKGYRKLGGRKGSLNIEVNNKPELIVLEVIGEITKKLNERY